MENGASRTASRRRFLVRSGTAIAAASALSGCTTTSSTSTASPTATAPPTPPSPESGKLKFAHFTPFAVCSLELEDMVSGETIEILELPNTHEKLKPRTYFTYASADYPQIDSSATYKITATTCDGNHSATTRRFHFGTGGVWTIRSW